MKSKNKKTIVTLIVWIVSICGQVYGVNNNDWFVGIVSGLIMLFIPLIFLVTVYENHIKKWSDKDD